MLLAVQNFAHNCGEGVATCLLSLGMPAKKVSDLFRPIRNT